MRSDGEPVRPGIGTTRRMSGTKQSAQQNGTQSAETIKASGHVRRANRPDTRLHPTTTPTLQIIPCNAGAIHTRHSNRHFRFRIVFVCFWGISGRMAGLSVESVVDPQATFATERKPRRKTGPRAGLPRAGRHRRASQPCSGSYPAQAPKKAPPQFWGTRARRGISVY